MERNSQVRRGRNTTKIVLFAAKGHSGRVQSPVISATYAANSLLSGSIEFCRRSTNFSRPNNRITMEIVREVKTAKSGQLAPLHIPPANTVRERPT
jgi:hypothetical protein